MPGTLYLIPNTLGYSEGQQEGLLARIIPDTVQSMSANLGYLIAENAKTTRAYLKLLSQNHPLGRTLQEIQISELNVNTPAKDLEGLLAPLLQGHDAGLISEAGVPAVADPGANLVRLAHQRGITVRPLVGPSSLLLGLMASGMNGQSFAFHGYLPTDAALRTKRIKELEDRSKKEKQTQVADRNAVSQYRDAGGAGDGLQSRHAGLRRHRPQPADRIRANQNCGRMEDQAESGTSARFPQKADRVFIPGRVNALLQGVTD